VDLAAAPIEFLPPRRLVTCVRCGDGRPRQSGGEAGIIFLRCRRCVVDGGPFCWKACVERRLSVVLKNQCWSGLDVTVVGGGRSVKRWRPKIGEGPTIACNNSWRIFQRHQIVPTVSWSADQLWLKIAARDKEYLDFVALRAAPGLDMSIPYGVLIAEVTDGDDYWARDLTDGIRAPLNNSGLSAIALADSLGAKTIKLIGFDMDGVGGDGSDQSEIHRLMLIEARKIATLARARVIVDRGPLCEVFK
jgi:hypothetical protein